jgi:hypothetical protein
MYDASTERGMLLFEKEGGGPDPVDAGRVAQVLASAYVPVVVLNACQSGQIGTQIEAAVAPRLIKDGTASVTTPLGPTYTLTGYTALDKATATVGESLTYTFEGEAFEEKFNRFTLTYSATAPIKVWVSYTERGKSAEEYFFLDAKEGQFSGLNTGFMKGYSARKLTALRVEPLTDKATAFTLAGVSTEKLEKLPKTYYLESDRYKLGIDLGWGGTVSYLEDKACTIPDLVNLVNRHDTGRLIQQSFYGVQENDEYKPGVSFDSKWRYNPVQGGDQYNNPSRLIDVVITANSLYIKSQPQDWALDNALTPSY